MTAQTATLNAAGHSPTAQSRDVALAASIDNPFVVFKPVVDNAVTWFDGWMKQEIANPFPILNQIVANQQYTVSQLGKAAAGLQSGVERIVRELPATWQQMEPLIRAGDINGAINVFMGNGLAPVTELLLNTWTPLAPALQRPFAVGQAYVPAMFEFSLSLLLGTIDSTVGLGFVFGTPPFVQQVVTSTQNVLGAMSRLDVVGTINAIQNGLADVALNAIDQLHKFTDAGGTIEFIRNAIINALKTPAPSASSVSAAALPDTSATLVSTAALAAPSADAAAPPVASAGAGAGSSEPSGTETGLAPTDPASTDGNSPGVPTPDGRTTDAPPAEPGATEPKATEPKATEPKATEPRGDESATDHKKESTSKGAATSDSGKKSATRSASVGVKSGSASASSAKGGPAKTKADKPARDTSDGGGGKGSDGGGDSDQ